MKIDELQPPVENCVDFSRRGKDFVAPYSGCYALTNASGVILYIGKATDLKDRMGKHLNKAKMQGKTPHGYVSVFHYRFCEQAKLAALEKGWLNHFKLGEGGALPYFNDIDAPSG